MFKYFLNQMKCYRFANHLKSLILLGLCDFFDFKLISKYLVGFTTFTRT